MNDSEKIYRVNNNEFFREFDNEMKDIQNTITFSPNTSHIEMRFQIKNTIIKLVPR